MITLRLTETDLEKILNMEGNELHLIPKSNNLLRVVKYDLSDLREKNPDKDFPDEYYLEIYI